METHSGFYCPESSALADHSIHGDLIAMSVSVGGALSQLFLSTRAATGTPVLIVQKVV